MTEHNCAHSHVSDLRSTCILFPALMASLILYSDGCSAVPGSWSLGEELKEV